MKVIQFRYIVGVLKILSMIMVAQCVIFIFQSVALVIMCLMFEHL